MVHLRNLYKLIPVLAAVSLILGLAGFSLAQATAAPDQPDTETLQPQVRYASKHDTSPALRDIASLLPTEEDAAEKDSVETDASLFYQWVLTKNRNLRIQRREHNLLLLFKDLLGCNM